MMKSAIRKFVPEPVLNAYKALNYRRLHGSATDPASVFGTIYKKRLWGKGESASGSGSTVAGTAVFRAELEGWLARNNIRSFVDLPCGDFHWMRLVRFPAGMRYTGIDIVPELVDGLRAELDPENGSLKERADTLLFQIADVLTSDLPEADAYLCKDLFIHFPNEKIAEALGRVREKASFLLATTFPNTSTNQDIKLGEARRVNMDLLLGAPIEMLKDFDDDTKDRFIGVWRM